MALLIAPSGVGRGAPSVIIPPSAYRPKAQMAILRGVGGPEAEAPVVR